VFDELQRPHQFRQIGAIGLGTGVIAAYGQQGQEMTFYEIDPAVTRIASNPKYFTYLQDSAATIQTVNGDGRLELDDVADGTYDLLIVDAFSSDAIPTHLMTREAFELYRSKVTADGLILVHISNRNLDLEPVVGAIARDLGMPALTRQARATEDEAAAGIYDSQWCVLAMTDEGLSPLAGDGRWRELEAGSDVWTDEFSDILGTLRWLK
jgi:spermidine synthase